MTATDPDAFVVRLPADTAKPAMELTHAPCGAPVCDVEPGDTLATLLATADGHVCHAPAGAE